MTRKPYNTFGNRVFTNSAIALIFLFLLGLLFSMGYGANHEKFLRAEVVVAADYTPTPTPTMTPTRTQEVNELKNYLKTVFGKEWKTAFGVAQSECNSGRKDWPKCKNSWAKEYSIGWFQINLAQDSGKGAKIHWDKVPGKTLQEKEDWLGNPYNNVLAAKLVYDQSGFNAWTAYTSKNYLRTLPK